MKYGLISLTDAYVLERTLDLIMDAFDDVVIQVSEIGVYSGMTTSGMDDYIASKRRSARFTMIDNNKDGEEIKFLPQYYDLIIGNSNEVYNQLEDNSQHLIFIDGDHSYIGVISDFYAYADKVKVGGYLAFHDTGQHIKPFKDFQHGDKNNPYAYISARKALHKLWLLFDADVLKLYERHPQWELIFDEADKTDEAGGITVFKRLF